MIPRFEDFEPLLTEGEIAARVRDLGAELAHARGDLALGEERLEVFEARDHGILLRFQRASARSRALAT